MKKCWSVLVLAAILCCFSSAALAADANETADALPRRFKGIYQWRDRKFGSEVFVKITDIRVANGLIWAEGEGRHVEEEFRTEIKVELVIDPATLAVEMWEQSPRGERDNPKFSTDGSYRGEIAPDLKTIQAVWTTASTGRKGTLTLKAN